MRFLSASRHSHHTSNILVRPDRQCHYDGGYYGSNYRRPKNQLKAILCHVCEELLHSRRESRQWIRPRHLDLELFPSLHGSLLRDRRPSLEYAIFSRQLAAPMLRSSEV